ncbi:hypothetical protein CEUSTIGMA_g2294.t1 [Chlamydomonas eustigma]|uniref:Uncharacterized protein n=1 Tax=Chlamydomonas eustigma TaxID=1157962 RepID=A0A250WVJ8_9CHLO|nr:hypothetical protein CEUSTIGMA_g2294.t1 [Chlamydomonas eustigma]|eukprot:GAX74848.1 hypothetical protein CEUSTIGMA_g2294.t1 [Chlamydomonas eustigma]
MLRTSRTEITAGFDPQQQAVHTSRTEITAGFDPQQQAVHTSRTEITAGFDPQQQAVHTSRTVITAGFDPQQQAVHTSRTVITAGFDPQQQAVHTSRTEITAGFDPQQQAVRLAALAMRDALYADPSLSPDGSDSSSRASSSRRDLHEQATCNSPCCIVGAKVNGTDHDPQHPYEGSRMWRMPACELQYGPLDCGFKLATFNKGAAMMDSHVSSHGGLTCTTGEKVRLRGSTSLRRFSFKVVELKSYIALRPELVDGGPCPDKK